MDQFSTKNPRKQNIILDLDHTLVHVHQMKEMDTFVAAKQLYFSKNKPGHILQSEEILFVGTKRPYLDMFLDYCLNRFVKVIVWSAGSTDYVKWVTDNLFKNAIRVPDFILSRPDTYFDKDNLAGIKNLEKLFMTVSGLDKENTFVLDDVQGTQSLNQTNGIVLPRYRKELSEMNLKCDDIKGTPKKVYDDRCLAVLMEFLSRKAVSGAGDVRELDKTNIFTAYSCKKSKCYNLGKMNK